jgi:hypothetical protein
MIIPRLGYDLRRGSAKALPDEQGLDSAVQVPAITEPPAEHDLELSNVFPTGVFHGSSRLEPVSSFKPRTKEAQ